MTRPDPLGTVLPPPYCSACGHDLTGATNSSSCPECGRPLVEVLTRTSRGMARGLGSRRGVTRRYTSETKVLGMPLLAIALGPDEHGRVGHARGYFAFGDIATGVFAFGGFARGLVAFGGLSIGGVTFGGLSLGTFAAFGGGALAWLGSAVGGFAVGLLAHGGGAVGAIAQGGFAAGWLARGAKAVGPHPWQLGATPSDATRALFDQYALFTGPAGGGPQIHYGLAWSVAIAIVVAAIALIPVALARRTPTSIQDQLARAEEQLARAEKKRR